MKILRIKVDGLPLYKDSFDVMFCAVQRVQENHLNMVYNLFGNIYTNNVQAYIGINASGKTTALKILSFTSNLLSGAALDSAPYNSIIGEGKKAIFMVDFYYNEKIYHLESVITKYKKSDGKYEIKILKERLFVKTASSKINKTNLLDFKGIEPIRVRSDFDEYLRDDVSIMIAVNKQIENKTIYIDLIEYTNINLFIPGDATVPTEIVSLLDPTIEYIKIEKINDKSVTKLKFYEKEEMVLSGLGELNAYLSSGTVKGLRVFSDAVNVLKNGGYLVVDEVENHFNRELVASLIRVFMNKRTNPRGATIVFSTHYPELLDELERNDSIYITRNQQGLCVDNLNSLISRNDMRKSEVYQSDFLKGTAPKYKAVAAYQKRIIKSMED